MFIFSHLQSNRLYKFGCSNQCNRLASASADGAREREAGESDAPTPDCSLHSRAKVVQACRIRSSGVQCESEVDTRSKSETVKRFEIARHVEFRKF